MRVGAYTLKEGLKYADELAVLISDDVSKQVRFANNEITTTKSWVSRGLELLFKKNKRYNLATLDDLSKNSINSFLKKLGRVIEFMPAHPDYAELPQGPFRYKKIRDCYDKRIEQIGDKIIDYVETAINSALESGAKRVAGTLETGYGKIFLYTSKQVEATHQSTSLTLEIRAFANSEASGIGLTCGTKLKDIDPKTAGEEAGKYAKLSLNPITGKAGKYDVILARPAVASILNMAGLMCSAFYVETGFSCFGQKIGKPVASEKFTLYDDGLAQGGLGSRPFDDEGYPTKRITLIENGVLKTYLHNSITARKHNSELTGNAGWVVPHPWNLEVKPGELSEEELIAQVKEGLFVTNATYIRFHDWRDGTFSAIVRDGVYKIKNGEITQAIKGLRLDDNLLHLLKNIQALSNQSVQVYHWWMEGGIPVKCPLILVKDLNFSVPVK